MVPLAIGISAVPIIAVAPIMSNWFGILNPLAKMAVVILLVFFPIMINVVRGLTEVSPTAIELMRANAASEGEVLRKLRLPNALPFFFTGLKVATTLSLIGAIVAEYFGGSSQVLGRVIVQSSSRLRFDITWSAILVTAVVGHRLLPARPRDRAAGHPVARLIAGVGVVVLSVRRRAPDAGSRRPTMPAPALPAGGRGGSSIVRSRMSLVGIAVVTVVLSACSSSAQPSGSGGGLTNISVQLQWVPQAQFAG